MGLFTNDVNVPLSCYLSLRFRPVWGHPPEPPLHREEVLPQPARVEGVEKVLPEAHPMVRVVRCMEEGGEDLLEYQ